MSRTTPPRFHFHFFNFFVFFAFHIPTIRPLSVNSDDEQTILLKLKQHWSDPQSISHWSSTSNHCSWPEITCNADGSVTDIKLINIDIDQTIPEFICDLKNLTHLDLQNNYIPGGFPTSLYNCTNLEYLDISQNLFIGLIPDDVHRMSERLQFLNLAANNFTGDIPVAVSLLRELRTLSLYQNLFNGSFPSEIGNLSNLEYLGLAFNDFSPSPIPLAFTQLKNLKQFYMTEANLVGEIPQGIEDLAGLQFLDLSVNDLVGNIPSGLFLLKNLTDVYLYQNHLSGSIPSSVQALDMKVIDLSINKLTGTIPDDFGKLTKLCNLTLVFNQLSGELPSSIGRLPSLIDIRIFNNNLSGQLPPDFGRYSKLKNFEVFNNRFTGGLPENLCANGVLLGVTAYENDLSGEVPASLGNCSSLGAFQIASNRFTGKIPDGLWSSENLTWLRISDNSFSGRLPDKLGKNLDLLEISNNQFSGEIPARISTCQNLNVFRASNNRFTGAIPQELTALSLLTTLLLDGNQLFGQLPSEIIAWNSLTDLNLRRNQLSGEIPSAIWRLRKLNYLDLSENKFSGEIPPEIGSRGIVSLNLSSNRFTGRIPGEFENAVYDRSFLNNPGLCANNQKLGLNICRSSPKKSGKISSRFVAVFASIAAVLSLIVGLFTFSTIRSYRKREHQFYNSTWNLTPFQRLNFTESDILSNLTENNVIGSGGSGKVYRVGVSRSEYVAVKRIWSNNHTRKPDHKHDKEFLAEVQILGTIRHSNVVKLKCYISSEESKLLVYEHLENRSLDLWLHGKKRRPSAITAGSVRNMMLDWPRRLKIAVGAARGLCYMHHECSPPIIHRDVKSSNVLLDSEFNAKIADFGLARILIEHGEPNTISTVAGSFGYIAPEYAQTSKVSEKIDVYSFGVILLELVTGKEANYGDETTSLAGWAWRHVQEGKQVAEVLDEDIKEPGYVEEMSSVFRLGIFCTSTFPANRPSIRQVLHVLLQMSSAHRKGESGCESAGAPLLKNSRRERVLEGDHDLVSLV